MAGVVVPFRGTSGKSRLGQEGRERLALAMLADVLAACLAVGVTVLVTSDEDAAGLAQEAGARVVEDPGRGQGTAVSAGLAQLQERPMLVVNSDLPAATPRDLLALLGAMPPTGMAIVEARDGSTNALALSAPHLFSSSYGPGSADRFRAHAARLGVELVTTEIPGLIDDVDTPQDLARLDGSLGRHTQAALSGLTQLQR